MLQIYWEAIRDLHFFLTPDNVSFLHSPENECLDDDRMLDSISEQLSYDEFASDG
jgi:hypothetical protein